MSSYKRFEDLPAWKSATALAVSVFKLTALDIFRFKGDLVNQCRRAALSIANNIAEGFERGTTSDLISYLYIARGSAGEVRSMLRFAIALGDMADAEPEIVRLIDECESVSRQIRAWLDSLQNSDIPGQRHLNDGSRCEYERRKRREAFDARLAEFSAVMNRKLRGEDVDGELKEVAARAVSAARTENAARATREARFAQRPAPSASRRGADSPVPRCPECKRPMAKRRAKDGTEFWGCTAFPKCHGSRSISKGGDVEA